MCAGCNLAPTDSTSTADTEDSSAETTQQVTTAPEPSTPEAEVVPSEPIDQQAAAVIDPATDTPDPQIAAPNEEELEVDLTQESPVVAVEETSTELDSLDHDTTYEVGTSTEPEQHAAKIGKIAEDLCRELGEKLGSVSEPDCLKQEIKTTDGKSIEGRALAIKNYGPIGTREPLGNVLVIGGIHGDEFSSVSVVFKWMEILNIHHSGLFNWRFIPVANPDGLLKEESQRQNANGVDLNRNFPTADWDANAKDYWINRADKRPRRYPGEASNSEPETQWLVDQIKEFKPEVIISMHAPYHLVDCDGPPGAPNQLGSLYLRQLGVYPGSLGNYAGVDLEKPIVTVELASAGILPGKGEISDMWDDLVGWLRIKLSE